MRPGPSIRLVACGIVLVATALAHDATGDERQLEVRIQRWVVDLDADKYSVRSAAHQQLLHLGNRAIPQLALASRSKSAEKRYRAHQILIEIRRLSLRNGFTALARQAEGEMDIDYGMSKFDMTIHCWESPLGLFGYVEYSSDLFDRTTIARLVSHWHTLLDHATRSPTTRLDSLAVLTRAETSQILHEWSDTEASLSSFTLLHEWVESQVARSPEAVAVCFVHAYAHPEHERQAIEIVRGERPDLFACASSEVL